MIDFDDINKTALGRWPYLLPNILPGGKFQGSEYVCGDLSGGVGESFSANIATGKWSDFATGEKGGDPVSLVAAIKGISQGEAARLLADMLGASAEKAGSPTTARKIPKAIRTTTPANTPPEVIKHYQHGIPSATWEYHETEGGLIGCACRFDFSDGKKVVIPFTHGITDQGVEGWHWLSFPKPRPLYGLARLMQRPDAPVLFLEGEKCADAAGKLIAGCVAITWPGGCKAVNMADFSPIKGRRVAIWPDNDRPGIEAAEAVSSQCLKAGAIEVSIIDVPSGKPEGWDVADALAEGWTAEQATAWVKDHRRRGEAVTVPDQPEQAEPRRFQLIPASKLIANRKPTNWLIKRYLEQGTEAALYSPPEHCKTFVAVDMGLCISAGIPWHGYAVQKGPVVYICGEGMAGISRRIAAWYQHHKIDAKEGTPFFVSNMAAQILDESSVQDIHQTAAAIVEEYGFLALLIIDTLNRNFGPGDENSTQDMTAFVSALDRLRGFLGCAVLVVHHTGLVDTERGRGSTALKGAMDFE